MVVLSPIEYTISAHSSKTQHYRLTYLKQAPSQHIKQFPYLHSFPSFLVGLEAGMGVNTRAGFLEGLILDVLWGRCMDWYYRLLFTKIH